MPDITRLQKKTNLMELQLKTMHYNVKCCCSEILKNCHKQTLYTMVTRHWKLLSAKKLS